MLTALDWFVLLGTMVGIAAYGAWRTRHTDHLDTYLKGASTTGWFTIGVSVAATQASAITFLSIPGQGFESGLGFVQNYFGLPLALVIVCAVFLPIYRRLGVYTAYEYLGQRFDGSSEKSTASVLPSTPARSAASVKPTPAGSLARTTNNAATMPRKMTPICHFWVSETAALPPVTV